MVVMSAPSTLSRGSSVRLAMESERTVSVRRRPCHLGAHNRSATSATRASAACCELGDPRSTARRLSSSLEKPRA
eukprot:1981439-Alexandrium_andersonii.AAC.1